MSFNKKTSPKVQKMWQRGQEIDGLIKANKDVERLISLMISQIHNQAKKGGLGNGTIYTFLVAAVTTLEEFKVVSLKK